ncbi:hypothetical protein GCM10009583_29640 [Ornithinicoccus hortensis]
MCPSVTMSRSRPRGAAPVGVRTDGHPAGEARGNVAVRVVGSSGRGRVVVPGVRTDGGVRAGAVGMTVAGVSGTGARTGTTGVSDRVRTSAVGAATVTNGVGDPSVRTAVDVLTVRTAVDVLTVRTAVDVLTVRTAVDRVAPATTVVRDAVRDVRVGRSAAPRGRRSLRSPRAWILPSWTVPSGRNCEP